MRLPILALLAAFAASPAASVDRPADAKRLGALVAGRTAGEPRQCLDRFRETGYQTIGGALVFRFGSDVYVNRTQGGGCDLAGTRDAIVVRAGISRLCSGDVARVVDSRTGVESGTCTLGAFVPYSK